MKTSEILQVARYLIHAPEWWYPGTSGARANCAYTACTTANVLFHYSEYAERARLYLYEAMGIKRSFRDKADMFNWNDSHTHAEVLAAFDQAIQLAQQDEISAQEGWDA